MAALADFSAKEAPLPRSGPFRPAPRGTRRSYSRRGFLRAGALGAGALAAPSLLAGCGDDGTAAVPPLEPGDDKWRRFAGTTINFISENTAPTAAIAANLQPFTQLTGINVQIVNLELSALVQRVALDLASGDAAYQVIYADPYQVLAPYSAGLVDLREFLEDDSYPPVEGGLDDFIAVQLDAAGRFSEDAPVYALPYDCPTMIWQYRQDLFDRYGNQMADALGHDVTPGPDRTWEEYYAIADWLNQNADEVAYGTGHQAKQHDSLMNDFSNVLWAAGGDYFEAGQEVGLLGMEDPGECVLDSEESMAAADFYASLLEIAHPASSTWDWDGVGAALRAGEIAMCPNWHEFAASNEEALPGKISYAPLPRGPARAANMYGGCGIGISTNAEGAERGAAWLFVNWATSPEVQLSNLKSSAGGGTPTRRSVYALEQVQQAETRPSDLPNMLTADAVFTAWEPQNIGLRPKIPMWNECDTTIFTELSKMIAGESSPSEAMTSAKSSIDSIVQRGWVA
jgi:multiple sugar transport system substrate-binding protein